MWRCEMKLQVLLPLRWLILPLLSITILFAAGRAPMAAHARLPDRLLSAVLPEQGTVKASPPPGPVRASASMAGLARLAAPSALPSLPSLLSVASMAAGGRQTCAV